MFFSDQKAISTRFVLILILLGGIFGMSPARSVRADTILVTNTNDSGPGSLRQAVLTAVSGDTIMFDPALAGQTITLDTEIALFSSGTHNLVIDGSGLNPPLTVSGGNITRIMRFDGLGSVKISNLAFTGGVSSGGGAIAFFNTDEVILENCHFYENQASGSGGALLIMGDGELTITNSTFQNNSATADGGAISAAVAAPALITGSTFSGNSAAVDGGANLHQSGCHGCI
jgi:predicted outer membrane repeat protein